MKLTQHATIRDGKVRIRSTEKLSRQNIRSNTSAQLVLTIT